MNTFSYFNRNEITIYLQTTAFYFLIIGAYLTERCFSLRKQSANKTDKNVDKNLKHLFNKIEERHGLDECFIARDIHHDESFIRQYLTREDCEDLNLFLHL